MKEKRRKDEIMGKIPHLVQYQGSKRILAPEIVKYIPKTAKRIIEPFAGTGAVSIFAAYQGICGKFVLNDINTPLIQMLELCIEEPALLSRQYSEIWHGQFAENENNIDYFLKIRSEFNNGKCDAGRMLFLLARVVKGAVRYNAHGQMNQSCDKRRYGTKPDIIECNAFKISKLLKGKTRFYNMDYKELLDMAETGDLVYLDPPYQGTSDKVNPRDNRYIQGVGFEEFAEVLGELNDRGIDYIVSYDGMTGDKKIGQTLPEYLNLKHMYINAGTSAQATLNGKNETTYESLYLSSNLKEVTPEYMQLSLNLA